MYDIVVNLIGELPLEFHFVYGLATMVAVIFGILLLFSPIMFALKLLGR